MRAYAVALLILPLVAWAMWQLVAPEPFISPLASGLILVVLGGLAGLRIGTESFGRFVKDLTALNKYLGEQNRDLAEMNQVLLKDLLTRREDTQDSAGSDSTLEGQTAASESMSVAGRPHSESN